MVRSALGETRSTYMEVEMTTKPKRKMASKRIIFLYALSTIQNFIAEAWVVMFTLFLKLHIKDKE
jgi:hypothetical protein